MESLIAEISIDVAATPGQVWRVLTEPALTRRYMFGCEPVTDWAVGSPLLWRGEAEGKAVVFVKGRVLAIEPGRYLQYTTFGEGMGLADEPGNYLTVTCQLEPLPGGRTRLRLSQGDFAQVERGRERFEDSRAGWPGVAAQIKALAEESLAEAPVDAGR
jgi:uncharacterized protein YndB with AHSA1/START domain